MNRMIGFAIMAAVFVGIDLYVWQAIKLLIRSYSPLSQRYVTYIFWGFTIFSIITVILAFQNRVNARPSFFYFLTVSIIIIYLSKIFTVFFMFLEDIIRFFRWIVSLFQSPENNLVQTTEKLHLPINQASENTIPRSEFIAKTALAVSGTHIVGMTFGILSGAHDYRIHRVKLHLKNLPQKFDGMTIAQLSDIHAGSFFNKTAVKGGVEMLLKEKPDAVFFTGDLVNNLASEVKDYIQIFDKVKAPLGVYSTLGNHDYADYIQWKTLAEKQKNLNDLIKAHQLMGWDLLLDEHRNLKVDGESIGILGIQNWGAGGFAKYGNLKKALEKTEDYPIKLLLSHDPSHWREQVLGKTDIDVAFAGHTHGMQYGVEIGNFRWSPVSFRYKEWAGLYQENAQQLYVNRGYGYIGYPGRLGILPEITVFELKKS
jgi:predicted MPP superfamily phosphohydrolase